MNINDYLLKDIKALGLQDSVNSAQKLFKNFPITHFPLVENGELLGSFAEDDMHTIENKEAILGSYTHLANYFFSDENATVLELLKIFADNDTNIIPVLNTDKNYIGYYDLHDVLDAFSMSPFMLEESETVIIEKLENDSSMSEVTQIVEANGGKLLGIYISEKHDSFLQVTLKIISDDMNEIMQNFRRYDYKIISSHQNDKYLEDLKYRLDYLQKYLDL